MGKTRISFLLVLILGLLSFGVVMAQDATPEATEASNVEHTLSDIVSNKGQYYGQSITTEGVIEDLINVRAFVLGDGASLGDNQVLVINNSNREFDLAIKKDQRVRLTGTLYPDFNSGGWNMLAGANTVNGASPVATQAVSAATPMATQEMMATQSVTSGNGNGNGNGNGMVDLTQMYIPDNLRGHTILVLTSLDSVTYIQNQ